MGACSKCLISRLEISTCINDLHIIFYGFSKSRVYAPQVVVCSANLLPLIGSNSFQKFELLNFSMQSAKFVKDLRLYPHLVMTEIFQLYGRGTLRMVEAGQVTVITFFSCPVPIRGELKIHCASRCFQSGRVFPPMQLCFW